MHTACLHGIRLRLDAVSAEALAPWLDEDWDYAGAPVVQLELVADRTRPAVLELFLEEKAGWLGRTASGLVVGNDDQAWFTIEGSKVRGVLGHTDATRELLVGALTIALRFMGVYLIHAGAVSFDDQALLLIGDSGAGKSTTAIALVSAGCSYLGDDGCMIREHSGDVELLALWSSFRLTGSSLARFHGLQKHTSKQVEDDKWKLDVPAAFPGRHLRHWLGRKTILFLGRSGEHRSLLHPLAKADAVGLLIAQSNALSLACHPNVRGHLELLARLASVACTVQLQLGSEWLSDPVAAGNRLLERLRSSTLPNALHGEAS